MAGGGPTIQWMDGFVGAVPAPGEHRGAKVERIVSHHRNVKHALRRTAKTRAIKARSLLAVHQANAPGDSTWIEAHEHEKLDWSVHLYSKRGVVAATAIEFGHVGSGAGGSVAPFQIKGKEYPGLFILHRAFGLKRE